MVNLTILVYFIPYLYLFAAFISCARSIATCRWMTTRFACRAAPLGAWAIAGCGLLATFIALGLIFVPPPGTDEHAQLRSESDRAGGAVPGHRHGASTLGPRGGARR